MKKVLPVLLLLSLQCSESKAQTEKKIVILGSSTAAGTVSGGGTYAQSWAGMFQASLRKNTSDNADTSILNLAYPGFVSYNVMPSTGYTPPANRTGWPVDPARNVNAAIAAAPDIVIISLPTNDAELPGFAPTELMGNLRLMYSRLTAANIKCFIATTQPRTTYNATLRQYIRVLRDSILNTFAQYSLNFWDDLADPSDPGAYIPALTGDGIHPNAPGHVFLFNRVVAKNVFAVTGTIILPVKLSRFQAHNNGNAIAVSWHTDEEEPQTFFEIERSANGRAYEKIGRIAASNQPSADYTYSDQQPLRGQSFYRLRIIESSKQSYSSVVRVSSDSKSFSINKMGVSGGILNLDLSSQKKQRLTLAIITTEGKEVRTAYYDLSANGNYIKVPVDHLARGEYFIRLSLTDGAQITERFMKL